MSANAVKGFKDFLELPTNLRTEIIDEMAPDDRCRFTRCSKLSNQEAKASKNYISRVYIVCSNAGIVVLLRFDEAGTHECCFIYVQHSAKRVEQCQMSNDRILWSVDFDESIDLYQYVNEKVRRLFEFHRNSLKQLSIHDSSMKKLDFEIEILNNLEEMDLIGDNDIQKLLSKLQKPLKKLWINDVVDIKCYTNCKQIYQVEQELILLNAQFNNQQFLQISTGVIIIHIGHLTEKDIFSFIRSWQDGTIGKEMKAYRWIWEGSDFDKMKLARLLRLPEFHLNPDDAEDSFAFEIKNFKEHEKSAILCFTNEFLDFDTALQDRDF